MVPILALVIAVVAAGLVCGVACFFLGVQHRKRIAEALIGTAEKEANRLKSDAMNEIESRKKEMRIEAKEEAQKIRAEADKEIRERRNDIQRQEKRIQQKEENLDKKVENLEAKEERNAKKEKQIEEKLAEVEQMKKGQLDLLEKISGFTAEQAKEEMLKALNDELDHEKAVRILAFKERTQEESDKIAKEIISRAIQRCAAENTGDATISVVSLPNDEMKGRIIGREGRNIRSFETVTGADLIIDDTPEAITVSCFDPVRREIARLALQSLVTDGRIHPAKIEETVEKTKREVNKTIKAKGERAVIDAGIRSINPDLVKLIGKLYYRTSFGQNVLNHSLEVCYLSGIMAAELGENVELAKRAGLLHDIGKGVDHEQEGTHIQLGVEIAKKYRENNDVIHAIEAHHGDVETKTVIASIVQAADAISAARPGARREQIENYIKRLEKLEEIAKSFEGVESSYAIQAGRELRILVKPDEIDEDKMTILAREIANKIESDMEYPGQIKVNLIRENRVFDIAK